MEFRILGPIEVDLGAGRLAPVPRGRALSLLALLLLHRGEVVPVDRVVEDLWVGAMPANPQNAVQVIVSRLRKELGDGVLVSQAGGYVLGLDQGMLDAERFENLLGRGQQELTRDAPAEAVATLRSALELWRGPALADVRNEPFAQPEIARLEDLRLGCLSDRIEADLALGRHENVVGELEGLVAEHPLHERLRGQLMLALYGAGRQAEALAVYREARRVLVDELGIEPSPELRELEQAILRQEGSVRVSPPTAPSPPARELRRRVTCVVADLVASGALGELLDPEALRRLLVRWHDEMQVVYERHGGVVRESLGDAILAVFGTPVAHEDDALRALRAAVAMRARHDELRGELEASFGVSLAVRAGVSTGEVVIPGGPASQMVVLGEVFSLAARLGQEAPAGEILLGEATRILSADTVGVEELRLARASTSPPAFRLVELPPTPRPFARPDAPLVGRAHELQVVRDAFNSAVAGSSCHLVTVLGEPGIGKSRLARELEKALAAEATTLTGRCLAYGDGVTYWPIRELVEQASGERGLAELVAGLDDGPAVARAVATALGLEEGPAGEETLWAFRRLFASLARERPLVVAVEDLHWGEPALLDLIDHLADWIRDAPVLILCLARPELLEMRPAWAGGKRNAISLTLSPLSPDESRELLTLRGREELEDDELSRMSVAAGGNPLFLEQLLAHLDEQGGGDRSMPPAIQALLAARLDLLGAAERSILECGAVEGEVFHVGSVCALSAGLSRVDAERMLQDLLRRDLLLPHKPVLAGEDAFRFRHVLIRDAAYDEVPKATRSELHERHADWLEELGDAVPEPDARIGFHLERAYRLATEVALVDDRARALSARAGQRLAVSALNTFRRGDISGQIGFLERAIDLLGAQEPPAVELLPRLAYALFEGGLYERATEVAERAIELADRLDLALVRLQSEVERDRLHLYLRPESVDVDGSIAVAEQAANAFREVGDDLGLARVSYLMSELKWMKGRSEESREHARHVVEAAHRAGSGFELVAGLQYIVWPFVAGPTTVPEAIDACISLELEFGPQRATELAGFRAVLEAMAGRFGHAREEMALARGHLAELGLRAATMWMGLFAAHVEMLAGDPEAAEGPVRDAERMAIEIGDRWFLAIVLVDLAHVLLGQERPDEAEMVMRRIEAVRAPSDMEWLIKRHAARGKFAARQGHAEGGLEDARLAVELADGTDLLLLQADARGDLVEVLLAAGRPDEAEPVAARALQLHAAKENVAGAARIRQLLRAL